MHNFIAFSLDSLEIWGILLFSLIFQILGLLNSCYNGCKNKIAPFIPEETKIQIKNYCTQGSNFLDQIWQKYFSSFYSSSIQYFKDWYSRSFECPQNQELEAVFKNLVDKSEFLNAKDLTPGKYYLIFVNEAPNRKLLILYYCHRLYDLIAGVF